MIHPHTRLQFIDKITGYGVVATRPIPHGTVTWVKDPLDYTLPPVELDRFPPTFRDSVLHYSYRNREGHYVLCWDHARFVNHSFRPNCIATAYDFELAVRDIAVGEQLVNDYGFLNILEPFRPHDEGTRRKMVYPDDLRRYHRQWDQQLKTAFNCLLSVEQPLQSMFPTLLWSQAQAVAMGEVAMVSILKNLSII